MSGVRPLAIGRKNFLFCGNHDAAEDVAIIYTFMGCCKLAEVDVRKWLNYFFTHVHDYDNDYSLDLMELLPHRLKQAGLLQQTMRILRKSWTFSKTLTEILEIPPRVLETLNESHNTGFTDGLPYSNGNK